MNEIWCRTFHRKFAAKQWDTLRLAGPSRTYWKRARLSAGRRRMAWLHRRLGPADPLASVGTAGWAAGLVGIGTMAARRRYRPVRFSGGPHELLAELTLPVWPCKGSGWGGQWRPSGYGLVSRRLERQPFAVTESRGEATVPAAVGSRCCSGAGRDRGGSWLAATEETIVATILIDFDPISQPLCHQLNKDDFRYRGSSVTSLPIQLGRTSSCPSY
jgi:hypothetical protein